MEQDGFAARLWRAPRSVRLSGIIALLVLAGVSSYLAIALNPLTTAVAAWWPAAGWSVLAVLASRGSRTAAMAGVFAVTATGNMFAGRELIIAVLFGIANAVEAWIVARLLTGGGPEARLENPRDVGRLLVAALAGAVAIAVIGGTTVAVLRDENFVLSFVALLASHLSAVLVVAPVGLVRRRFARSAGGLETVVQIIVLVVVVAVVFWPGAELPIGFVPFIALLWAAFRLSPLVLAIELIVVSVAATMLTASGGGPFSVYLEESTWIVVALLQAFFIINATAALFVSASRNEWANVVTQLEARQALLRGGIVSADTGMFIGERLDSGRIRIVGVNPVALEALGWDDLPGDWENRLLSARADQPLLGFSAIDDLVRAGTSGRVELVRGVRRYDVDVATYSQAGGRPIVTIIFTDVTARDRRERLALQTADELRELNRQKDDFIASVSHELRTPVTSILGFAEQLTESDLDGDTHVAGRIIYRNARRLADVIEDVLELSRLTSTDGVTRSTTEVDARRLITECVEDATGLVIPGRDVRVELRLPDHPVTMLGVEQDLARVCANLLSNAVKFSPAGGTVTVTLTEDGESLELRIADEGPGIPLAEQEAVWERFYRVQSPRHRDVPGTGLGLPIVRALVRQRIGGDVELISDGEHGTTAVVRVPRRRARVADTEPAAGADQGAGA